MQRIGTYNRLALTTVHELYTMPEALYLMAAILPHLHTGY